MKKSLIIFSVFLALQGNAQFLNSDFENWTNEGSYETPDGWATSDDTYKSFDILGLSHPASVVKEVSSYSGNYALKVQNISGTYMGSVIDTLPGFAVVSHTNGDDFFEGFAYSQRPVALTGYYKFMQGGSGTFPHIDTAAIVVSFSKWNAVSKYRETVGGASLMIYTNASSFTSFSLDITYLNGTVPDSAIVMILSSSAKVHYPGTTIIVDNLTFTGAGVLGISYSLLHGKEPFLYPNPAVSQITIKNIPKEAAHIRIMNFTEKEVLAARVSSDYMNVAINNFPAGTYFYSIVDAHGQMLYKNKFNIMN